MKATQVSQVQLTNAQGEIFMNLSLEKDYILAKWRGHISADDVIAAAKAYLEFLKQNPHNKLFNDKSEVTGDWQDANDWLEYDWLPKAYDAGLRFMAHVYSHGMFSQLSAHDLRERVDPPLLMKNFVDSEQAMKWLLKAKV